jgi:curved DNA-binding protein CbpA
LSDAEGSRALRELAAGSAAVHDSLTILGLEDAATLEQVKAQYREVAKLYHPDKAGNAEMMVKINQAYELLCKELKPQSE